jgi:hypothetical protein
MPVNGTISGHVLLRTPAGMTLPPIVPAFEIVNIYDTGGTYVAVSYVTATGDYSVPGVPAGTYYASVSGNDLDQIWPGIDCDVGSTCDPLTGSPIAIGQGENLTGIDFDPVPLSYVFGHVTDNLGAPVAGVAIDLWNTTDSTHCGVAVTNADGDYAATDTVFPCYLGHRVSTDAASDAYVDEVFDGILCPAGSAYLGLCSLDPGTVLPIPTTPQFAIANFVLGPRPDEVFTNGFDP